MKFSKFQQMVVNHLDTELPPGEKIIKEGRAIAGEIKVGRTAFFDKMGVNSEADYKEQCIKTRKIMYHAHLGMGSWEATAKSLEFIYRYSNRNNFDIDRVGICLDRRMALPENLRQKIPAETGPLLKSMEDWHQIGNLVPIQPHMGDFMIGFPASCPNTIHALNAGVTTIGNLSQFFSHEAPQWDDHVTTTVETVKSMAILAGLRQKGVLLHSYLEDGRGALFTDCTTIAGWAFLEKYIVENLLGAKLSHCMGGLTSDPIKRMGWVFALDQIHDHQSVGSMIYGNTISLGRDFTVNRGLIADYLVWDILAQLKCPTGHAVHPLPVTEAIRIPSAAEIFEIQKFSRRIEETARKLFPHFNFTAPMSFGSQIVSGGKTVFNNSLAGLKEAGVDITDPVQLLYILKKIKPDVFEDMFGLGKRDDNDAGKRIPKFPTDVFLMRKMIMDQARPFFSQARVKAALKKRQLLIASTDVHEHAVSIMAQLLTEAGARVTNLGAEVNPGELADRAQALKADAILLSTHNGMALEYASQLKEKLKKKNLSIPVLMGGVLNQKFEDQELPVDVTGDLKALGFHTSEKLDSGIPAVLANKNLF